MVYWWLNDFFWRRCEGGLGSERSGRQTNHDEFSRQIVNLAPHKILDNFYISRIYLVYVLKNELISHASLSHDKSFII